MMKRRKIIAIACTLTVLGASAEAYDPIYFGENSHTVINNGIKETVENAPLNLDGTFYIPLREFAKQLGYEVYWNDGKVILGKQSEEELSQMYNEKYVKKNFLGAEFDSADMDIIKKRLSEAVYSGDADPTGAISKMKEDGSFEEVEYYNSDTMIWSANKHIQNVLTMVKAAYSPDNKFYGDVKLKEKISKALDFWVNGGRVECNNWWQQEIGVPKTVADILILNPEEITPKIRETLNKEAARGSIFNETTTDRMTERPVANTGANLTDKLLTCFKIDIATGNEEELYSAMHLLENELRIFPKVRDDEYGEDSDGIKADYSFHQHVDQIQSGSYGVVLVDDVSMILNYIKGTKYMISDYALNQFANLILDGQQWMFRNDYMDLTIAGRHITRKDGIRGMRSSVKNAVLAMDGLTQIDRYEELQKLKADRLEDGDSFSGNKHFWLSDYASHNRDGFHIGLKIASSRTKCGEVVNNENLLGYYLSDGVTVLMQDGDEYFNILPLWNWNRLPGTTTPQGGLKNLNDWAEWNGEHLWNWKGNRSFVGGVSDGMYGAGVMDYSRDGLDAKKSWFMFDDEMVCLGSGINSYTDMNILTTLNQCKKDGDVVVSKGGKKSTLADGNTIKKNVDYILHDNIGYITKSDVSINIEERMSKYEVINLGTNYKDLSETNSIFELSIDHGVKPENAAYEYRTVFGADSEKMDKRIKDEKIKVLKNDDSVAAVYDSEKKILESIFYKMGKLSFEGTEIETNKKCALIYKDLGNGEFEITVSNPTNEPKAVNVTVNKAVGNEFENVKAAEGKTTLSFRLNEGIYAGSSTTFNSKTGFSEFLKN